MPVVQSDIQRVREAQARARQLGLQAAQISAGATTFSSEVMDRVRAARAQRGVSTLAQDIGTTTGQLASEGAALRERTMEVNPLDVDKALAAQRGQTLGALTTQARFAEERAGTMEETIEAGTDQMVAQAQLKQAEAELAAQEARDIMDLLKLQMSARTEAGGLSISEALKLEDVFEEREIEEAKAMSFIGDLDTAINLVENEGLRVAGPVHGRTLKLRRLVDSRAGDFLRTSQKLTTERMFEMGGKVLPAQEIRRLEPFLPTSEALAGKTDEDVIKELKDMRATIEAGIQARAGTPSFLPLTQEFAGLDIKGGGGLAGLEQFLTRLPMESFEE